MKKICLFIVCIILLCSCQNTNQSILNDLLIVSAGPNRGNQDVNITDYRLYNKGSQVIEYFNVRLPYENYYDYVTHSVLYIPYPVTEGEEGKSVIYAYDLDSQVKTVFMEGEQVPTGKLYPRKSDLIYLSGKNQTILCRYDRQTKESISYHLDNEKSYIHQIIEDPISEYLYIMVHDESEEDVKQQLYIFKEQQLSLLHEFDTEGYIEFDVTNGELLYYTETFTNEYKEVSKIGYSFDLELKNIAKIIDYPINKNMLYVSNTGDLIYYVEDNILKTFHVYDNITTFIDWDQMLYSSNTFYIYSKNNMNDK